MHKKLIPQGPELGHFHIREGVDLFSDLAGAQDVVDRGGDVFQDLDSMWVDGFALTLW